MTCLLVLFGWCVESSQSWGCVDPRGCFIGNFQSAQSGKCLIPCETGWDTARIRGTNFKNTFEIEMSDCPSEGSPIWNANDIGPLGPDGIGDFFTYVTSKALSRHIGYNACLNLLGGDATNANKVGLWDCYESRAMGQHWKYDNESSAIYMINSTKCLQSRDSTHAVEIWDCKGGDAHKVEFLARGPIIFSATTTFAT